MCSNFSKQASPILFQFLTNLDSVIFLFKFYLVNLLLKIKINLRSKENFIVNLVSIQLPSTGFLPFRKVFMAYNSMVANQIEENSQNIFS